MTVLVVVRCCCADSDFILTIKSARLTVSLIRLPSSGVRLLILVILPLPVAEAITVVWESSFRVLGEVATLLEDGIVAQSTLIEG